MKKTIVAELTLMVADLEQSIPVTSARKFHPNRFVRGHILRGLTYRRDILNK